MLGVNQPVHKKTQKKMGLEASDRNDSGPGMVRLNGERLERAHLGRRSVRENVRDVDEVMLWVLLLTLHYIIWIRGFF